MKPFQERVQAWVVACFGHEYAADLQERNARFLEEAAELVQANGVTYKQAVGLIAHVYCRPKGELKQEVGGVMTTLASLCAAYDLDMQGLGETELARVLTNVDEIREKSKTKVHFSNQE